jgi:hypothetical protein
VVAEVFDGQNNLLARGTTGPVDFNAKAKPNSITVTIFLRPVNAFTFANSAATPTVCSTLTSDRAAHTATTLENGKVLIAGGYQLSDGNAPTYLNSTEIYDPIAGTITPGPNLNIPRAYHTATHVPGTQYTVIAGGEGMGSANAALQVGEIYDESANSFTVELMAAARSRHVAAVPLANQTSGAPGLVVIIGGQDGNGPLTSVEIWDPANNFTMTPLNIPAPGRTEAAAVPIACGVLVVGGYDGVAGAKTVTGVTSPNCSTFGIYNGDLSLQNPHIFPLAGTLAGGSIIVMDGFAAQPRSTSDLSSATNSCEVISTSMTDGTMSDAACPNAPSDVRGFGGAAPLLNGRLLVGAGGGPPGVTASATADVLLQENGINYVKTSNLAEARVQAAFTTLQDGTVLVTGGYRAGSDGNPQTVNSVEVYQPEYVISSTSAYQ